jgi:hypothetical protein
MNEATGVIVIIDDEDVATQRARSHQGPPISHRERRGVDPKMRSNSDDTPGGAAQAYSWVLWPWVSGPRRPRPVRIDDGYDHDTDGDTPARTANVFGLCRLDG